VAGGVRGRGLGDARGDEGGDCIDSDMRGRTRREPGR
jgi:hypothetical protein